MKLPRPSHVTELPGAVSLEISVGVCGRSTTQRVFCHQNIKRGAKKVISRNHSKGVRAAFLPLAAQDGVVGVDKLSRAAVAVLNRIQPNPSRRVSNVSLADVGAEEDGLRRAVTARFTKRGRRRSILLLLGGRGILPVVVASARHGSEDNDDDYADPAGLNHYHTP